MMASLKLGSRLVEMKVVFVLEVVERKKNALDGMIECFFWQ